MKPTDKQIAANCLNAAKSTGPSTPEGKALASRNSLRHGLLAKESVITAGEGAENQEQFDTLLSDLKEQFDPKGTMEEMLVEKIAVAYWRFRRICRYETGLIRQQLDTATDNFYNEKKDYTDTRINRTDDEIDKQIEQEKESVLYWEKDKKDLSRMHKEGKSLDEILDWDNNWEWLEDKYQYLISTDEDYEGLDPSSLRKFLSIQVGWSDDRIWNAHIELCDERAEYHKQQILDLQKEKETNHLKLQVKMLLGSIPAGRQIEQLLKYEGSYRKTVL